MTTTMLALLCPACLTEHSVGAAAIGCQACGRQGLAMDLDEHGITVLVRFDAALTESDAAVALGDALRSTAFDVADALDLGANVWCLRFTWQVVTSAA